MKLEFVGAAGEVTGSCYMVETGDIRFLVDCGMFQGGGESEAKNEQPWPFDPKTLNFALLTHAHFDHCGRLPKLYHDGFRGKIYTTLQTAELANLILADAADLMFHQAKEHHTHPLYTLNEVKALNGQYQPVPYDHPTNIEGVDVTFHDAGHVLGSAMIEIKAEGKTIVFSGDIGNDPVPFMNTPEKIPAADIVVMESTYGDRLHEHSDRLAALKKVVADTVARHGTLLIPAFALERTQEILFYFNELKANKAIPDIPIFVDSPLAIEITGVFKRNEAVFDQEAKDMIQSGHDIFTFPHLRYCSTVEESKSIRFIPAPKIIIAGSGMMNGGRILHHLQEYGSNKSTIICIVGFQVEGTLGRRIMNGEREVSVFGQPLTVNAEVTEISSFSAHADQTQLLDWIGAYKKLKQIYVIHGEEGARHTFASKVKQKFPNIQVFLPQEQQSIEI